MCEPRFSGTFCDRCSESYVGSECQILRNDCGSGMFVQINARGDYGCVCDPGFEGESCELCEADAYPKPTGFNQDQMCLNIVPPSVCANGRIKDDFDALNRPSMDMCDCDENFTSSSNCVNCVSDHYGPNCDILCKEPCFDSGGVCGLTGCVCPESMQLDVMGQQCLVCVEGGCENGGTCSNGRCRCSPGLRRSLPCRRLATRVVCATVRVMWCCILRSIMSKSAPCLVDSDCSDKTNENVFTRNIAVLAERRGWELFCYLTDTPQSLHDVDGCCVDEGGVCLASYLNASLSECEALGGDYVLDICNMRVLEGEVNIYDWCLAKQRGCTKNGRCSDPEFCEGYDPSFLDVDWGLRWNNEHFASMSTLMSEPFRFPLPFEDPYAYRKFYENVTLEEVCGTMDVYSECRATLMEGEFAWNASLGRSMPVANYRTCPQPERLRRTVDGRLDVSVTPKVWGRVHVVGDFVVQAYLKGDTSGPGGVARRYVGEIGAKVDSLIVIGRGEVEIILYDYVSDACESLQIRASKFAQCETLEIVELDYDWGTCAWHRNMSGEVGFDEQSTSRVARWLRGVPGVAGFAGVRGALPGLCSDPRRVGRRFAGLI